MHRWLWTLSAMTLVGLAACGGDDEGMGGSGATGGSGGSGAAGGDGGTGGTGGEGGMAEGGGGQGGGPLKPSASLTLTFIDDVNIDSSTTVDGIPFGGLSGLWIDPTTGSSWAICDDQEQFGPLRLYALDVTLDDSTLTVTPQSFTIFQPGATPSSEMDAEGIARTPNGELYISSEGDTNPVIPPAILRLDATGAVQEELLVDSKFVPDGSNTSGVRRNQGFESLTLTPSGNTLYVANEGTLYQDGEAATFTDGNRVRIVRYDTATGMPTGEFVYRSEPIPEAAPGVLGSHSLGVVELLAIGEDQLLVLERSGVEVDNVFSNTIRVFEVFLADAVDVSGSPSLPVDAPELDKAVVLDLDSIIPDLDPAFPKLDNVEGMSFGPTLPDGGQSLILVSDNNFNSSQRTVFFAFAIDAAP